MASLQEHGRKCLRAKVLVKSYGKLMQISHLNIIQLSLLFSFIFELTQVFDNTAAALRFTSRAHIAAMQD